MNPPIPPAMPAVKILCKQLLWRPCSLLIALSIACLAVPRQAQALTPAPDGGYPNNNTAEGDRALSSLAGGSDNTAIGAGALFSDTSGGSNTACGSGALNNNNGDANTATGAIALLSNGTGSDNTADGYGALSNNNGSGNTAVGSTAMYIHITGDYNTAIGGGALGGYATGNNNTATGFNALYSTTANNNTASGDSCMFRNSSGHDNTAAGYQALFYNTTGSNNVVIGSNAGINLTTGSNNIDIGNRGVAGEAAKIRIGTVGTQKATFIAGIRGVTVAGGVGVIVGTNGQLGTTTSSARFKEAIKPMDKASEAILGLHPVTFRYKHELDPDGIPQFGLVAEQVEKVNPDLVVRGEDGKVMTVRYEAVNAMLLNEFLKEHSQVQELKATVTQQQEEFHAKFAQQQKEIEALTATVQKMSDQIALSKPAPQLVANP